MCTASAVKLQEHVDSKHSKNGFEVGLQVFMLQVVNRVQKAISPLQACFPNAQTA